VNRGDDRYAPIFGAADEIIELVRSTSVGGGRGDSSGLLMFSAYLQGYRRLRVIRDVARTGAGSEAVILARSLVSLVARAVYVDAPREPAERRRRFLQYRRRDLQDQIRTTRALVAAGFDIDDDLDEHQREIAQIGDVGDLPSDASLMRSDAGLGVMYARVYAPGSDHVHFSQRVALGAVRGSEQVDLDARDPDLAAEALTLGVLTFGELLHRSERTIQHRLTDRVGEIARQALAQPNGGG
jgi:hypothetical protein